MSRLVCFAIALLLVVGIALPAMAQQKYAPEVTVMLKSADELIKDLGFIMKLTSKTEQKQWPLLQQNLDIFLIGIDHTRPIRVDVFFGGKQESYKWSLPISNLREFRKENLDPLGIESRKRFKTLYRLKFEGDKKKQKDAWVGYLRYKHGYATIADTRAQVSLKLPDPVKAIQPLLDRGFDIALSAKNQAEGTEDRRESFQTDRKELLAAIKKKKDESSDDYVLRKMLFRHQLDEAEQYYVEASQLTLGWVTDVANKHGQLDIELAALEGTKLAASIKAIDNEPNRFANVQRTEDPILSGRLNYLLDELRKTHVIELLDHFRDRVKHRIADDSDRSGDEKAHANQVADLVHGLFASAVKAGLANGFVEVHPNSAGKNTFLFGFRSDGAPTVPEILKLLPKAKIGQKTDLDLDKQGQTAIHKFSIDVKEHANYQDFFGSDVLYVGNSKDAVWLATGENALSELKTAIEKTDLPNTGKAGDPFIDVFAKMGPWIELRHKRDPKKGDVKLRKLAMDAFKLGEDTLSFKLRRVDDRLVGKLLANPGILRFAGKLMADFSKENLE